MRLIVLVTLKDGVSHEEYQAWAKSTDLPTVRALPSIAGFDLFRATGVLGGGKAPYDYVEIIDIGDMDAFGSDVVRPEMQAIAAQFAAFADTVFITTEPVA
ncbi:MAG: REDY-like protein HapK [Pseudomonadota bacterium]|uniref:REDY-like protein HapK n=1 Tax=Rhizorhabdus phycosphaerae TaxID=2711156 RepID=UPI0013EA8B3C|nr:REDY-like protein HapK [Rhizorhabdus phycosphaerae]